jgi:acyl-coenzyme A thioesterase PaaI-like protein
MTSESLAGRVSATTGEPDPWRNRIPIADRGGPGYAELIGSTRAYLDALAAANIESDDAARLAEQVRQVTSTLQQWAVDEDDSPIGTRVDLPGRGHPLLLPFVADEWTGSAVRGRVTFGRFHLGGNGAAHGGTLPLLFDEVMGRLNSSGGRTVGRTAYLHVNYRRITPIGRQLQLDATLDRVEGRKRFVTGRLHDGDTLVADAEGLFVELLPGQP